MVCEKCGKEIQNDAEVCEHCEVEICPPLKQKSKTIAVVLAIFLPLGIYNFYLGYTRKAVIQLVLTIVGWITIFVLLPLAFVLSWALAIWQLVEAVMILVGRITTDGKGIPLK